MTGMQILFLITGAVIAFSSFMKNGFLYLTLLHFFKQLFLSFAEVCGQLHVVCDDEVTHSAVASVVSLSTQANLRTVLCFWLYF